MTENADHNAAVDMKLPYADTAELKSNQSVRATFKLSKQTILALTIVSNQLKIKQKSLFDHLIADTATLETIAREIKTGRGKNGRGVQKTYVISRKTLSNLQKVADAYNAPRDALVEFSIQRLRPVIEQEMEKLEVRKELASKMGREVERLRELLNEAHEKLGIEDPIYEHLSIAAGKLENAYLAVMDFVQRSEKVSEFKL